MFGQQKVGIYRLKIVACLILSGWVFLFCACANTPRTLDRSIPGPQVIVNPEFIRLSVSRLIKTNIVFEGSGFKPGDSVFISLIGPKEVKAIVAEAPIQPDGTFRAPVATLSKVMEILRGDVGFDEKFQNVVIIYRSPIPEGVYTVKVTSMLSDRTADSNLTVKGPSLVDRLKDWIGSLTGKIQHKEAK